MSNYFRFARPDARPGFVREMSPERREQYLSSDRIQPGARAEADGAVRVARRKIRRKAKSLGARKGKDARPTAALSAPATIEQGDDRQDVPTASCDDKEGTDAEQMRSFLFLET